MHGIESALLPFEPISAKIVGIISRFSYLRQFAPAFLRALDFKPETSGDNPCLEALALLKALNAANKRTLPADAPTEFVPKALQRFIRDRSGKLQKSAWECALLTQLKEDIRAGNLSVAHSKRFGRFDDFFITNQQWAPLREGFFQRAGLPQDPAEVPDHLRRRLNDAYDRFLASVRHWAHSSVHSLPNLHIRACAVCYSRRECHHSAPLV
jgi:hypothetical protein